MDSLAPTPEAVPETPAASGCGHQEARRSATPPRAAPAAGLQVAVESHRRPRGPLHLVTLTGDLDAVGATTLLAHLGSALAAPMAAAEGEAEGEPKMTPERVDVVVNLSGVDALDAPGLAGLVELHRRLIRAGGTVHVTGPRPPVRRFLAANHTEASIHVHETVADALGDGH